MFRPMVWPQTDRVGKVRFQPGVVDDQNRLIRYVSVSLDSRIRAEQVAEEMAVVERAREKK